MKKFYFSLASKQVILSISLLFLTLFPLVTFVYYESIKNIHSAYTETIEASLLGTRKNILQSGNEENIIRSLYIKKIKEILKQRGTFTANYVEYLAKNNKNLEIIEKADLNESVESTYNFQYIIYNKDGSLATKNTQDFTFPEKLYETMDITLDELDSILANKQNSFFYVYEKDQNKLTTKKSSQFDEDKTEFSLLHIEITPSGKFYLVSRYVLDTKNIKMQKPAETLYNALQENFTYKNMLEGGFFIAIDTRDNSVITQSKNNTVFVPKKNIEEAICPISQKLIGDFTQNNTDYYYQFNYLESKNLLFGVVLRKEQIRKSTQGSMVLLTYIILGTLLIGSLLAFYFGKTLMRPLILLKNVAKKIPLLDFEKKTEKIQDLPLERRDEIGDLARTFSEIQGLLYKNVANLVDINTKNQRIAGELKAAREMQLGLLPSDFPRFSMENLYNINAFCFSAREVGGDLYDFFMVDDTHLCFYIGDVSGKGMSAAFFMSIASTLIQINMKRLKNVKLTIENLNEQLCNRNPENLFLSLFLALYNTKTGELIYANAGHLPPLILGEKTCHYERMNDPNFIIGLIPDIKYQELQLQIEHNQMIYLYTDGITEALSEKRPETDKFYGEERLKDSLTKLTQKLFLHSEKEEALQNILMQNINEISEFCDGTQQSDDIACIALYRP